MKRLTVAIIVPCFNEEQGINKFFENLMSTLVTIEHDFRVFFVDDGSNDRTFNITSDFVGCRNVSVRSISLAVNSGKEICMLAGLDQVTQEEAVIIMDADLQHPPKYIPNFIALFDDNTDAVIGLRENTSHDSLPRRLCSAIFRRLIELAHSLPTEDAPTDYSMISNLAAMRLRSTRHRYRSYLYTLLMGHFRLRFLTFRADTRANGISTFHFSSLLLTAGRIVFGTTRLPVILSGYIVLLFFIALVGRLLIKLAYWLVETPNLLYTLALFEEIGVLIFNSGILVISLLCVIYLYIISQILSNKAAYELKRESDFRHDHIGR